MQLCLEDIVAIMQKSKSDTAFTDSNTQLWKQDNIDMIASFITETIYQYQTLTTHIYIATGACDPMVLQNSMLFCGVFDVLPE